MFLGAIEAVTALLFLIPRTFRAGAVGLLITVSIALIVHVALGEFRGDLLFYDATVFFAFVHGPLTAPQWRTLVSPPAV